VKKVEDDLYEILDVPPGATGDEIRAAYRKLSKMYHPDSGGTPAFFRRLQDAYYVLSDDERRAAYDGARRQDPDSTSHIGLADPGHQWGPGGHGDPASPPPSHPPPHPPPPARAHTPASVARQFVGDLRRAVDTLIGRVQGDRRDHLLAASWITLAILGLLLLVVLVIESDGLIVLFLVIVGVALWLQGLLPKD